MLFLSLVELAAKIVAVMIAGAMIIAFIIWLNCGPHVTDRPDRCHTKPVHPQISRIVYGDYYELHLPVVMASR